MYQKTEKSTFDLHSTPCSLFLDLDFDFGFGFLSLLGFLSLETFFLAEGGADLAEDGADLAEEGLAASGLAERWSSTKWRRSQIGTHIAVHIRNVVMVPGV